MCLPGRDWTQCNGERWHLLAPRRKERLPLLSLDGDADSSPESVYLYREINPTQYLFGDVSWNSWNRLAKPSPPDHTSRSPHKVSSPLGSHALFRKTSLAPLKCMPAELLALILADDALERQDILALGLSSIALWPHAVQCVREACFDAAAPWAGTPIACLGNYLLDLPPRPGERMPRASGTRDHHYSPF